MRKLIISLSLGVFLAVPIFVLADHNTSHTIQQLQAQIAALQAQLKTINGSAQVSSPVLPPTSPLPTVAPSTGPGSATAVGVGQAVGPTLPPILISDDDTSNDDIIQLNNLGIESISSPTLPSIVAASYDIGVGCRKFHNLESTIGKDFPCPLAPTRLYQIRVATDTILLLRNRQKASFADFKVGDRINVYGFMDQDTKPVDALVVRNLDKPQVKEFIQLNNVEVITAPVAVVPPSSFKVAHKNPTPCLFFGESGVGSGTVIPCPLGESTVSAESIGDTSSPADVISPPHFRKRVYLINATANTKILARDRSPLTLKDIELGDTLNIYGHTSPGLNAIEALVIRNLSKPVVRNTSGLRVEVQETQICPAEPPDYLRCLAPIRLILDATVLVFDRSGSLVRQGNTASGAAVFENVPFGTYTIRASADGYEDQKIEYTLNDKFHSLSIRLNSLVVSVSEGTYSAIHSARTYTIYPSKPTDPILIFIHGGGWRIGSKDNKGFLSDLKELQTLGMNVYSIDYRLSPEAKWPAQIQDVKCMLSFLATSPAAIGNKQRIFLFGHSAGGHLALMAALTKKEDFDDDCEWRGRGYTIIGVVASSPAIDLTNMSPRGLQVVEELLGYNPLGNKEGAIAASPINYPSQDDPKVLLLTGGLDTLTKATENGQRFVNAFKAVRKNIVWYNFPNEGHNSSITDPQGQIFEKVREFLQDLL